MSKTASASAENETAVRAYELMFVLKGDLLESKAKKKVKEIEEMITKSGAKLTQSDYWGTRKLAYRIKQNDEGIYIVMNFENGSEVLKDLNQQLRIDPEVLRHLVLTLPAGYQYTRYTDEKAAEAPRERSENKFSRNVSLKHNSPVTPAKKEETVDKKAGKEVNASDLDAKLDEIIGGTDLNL